MLLFGQDQLDCRLLLGSAMYPSPEILSRSVRDSGTKIVTVSLRRLESDDCENHRGGGHDFWNILKSLDVRLLPNTANCRSARQAVETARACRQVFDTNWIKLEVIADDLTLQPDPFELVAAARELVKEGFEVFPYCTYDLAVATRLVDAGCRIVMPWAAPIGSGMGPVNLWALDSLRQRLPDVTLIVDAGIGKPSHATRVMELGYDGVLVNSAVALSDNPQQMARAFSLAVLAGRLAFESGMMPERNFACPSTPSIGTPFWHEHEKVTR